MNLGIDLGSGDRTAIALIDGRKIVWTADFTSAFEAMAAAGRQARRIVIRFVVHSMAAQYGAPTPCPDDLPWVEIGTEACRLRLLEEVEHRWTLNLSDDDREGVQTIGDLVALVAERAK